MIQDPRKIHVYLLVGFYHTDDATPLVLFPMHIAAGDCLSELLGDRDPLDGLQEPSSFALKLQAFRVPDEQQRRRRE